MTSKLVSGEVKYGTTAQERSVIVGLIPEEHWSVPSWIDEDKAAKAREELERQYHLRRKFTISTYVSISKWILLPTTSA